MSSNLTTQDQNADEQEFEDELKPGTKLLRGQYVIEQFLNNGGFGITYLAKDSLDRLVVIKECYPESICRRSNSTVRVRSRNQAEAFRTIVDMFIEEARNLARLSHPNIVGIHQVFEDNDTAYLAMDFVEGRDLLEIVESSNAFNPSALEAIVIKLLDAIEFIHHEGILHRDISPDNILLSNDNEPVLIDFGAARETVNQASHYLGSMRTVKDGYSPQEFYVADSEQFPSSDLYSLAASLYHVMTKELPVNAQERLTAIVSGNEDPYVSIKDQVTGYSEPFLDAIDHALDVFPKNRIQSAADWRAMITQTDATQITRGLVSRPMLAVADGNVIEQFEENELNETPRVRGKSDKQISPRKVRPRSGPAHSKPQESVFLSDDVPVGTAPTAGKTSVNLSPGKGLYLGVATAALIAIVVGGVVLTASNDDAGTAGVSTNTDTQVADNAAAEEPTIQNTPTTGATDPETRPTPERSGLFLTEMPDGAAITPTNPIQDESSAGQASDAKPEVELSVVQVETTPEAETANISDTSSVMIGKAVEFSVVADPNDAAVIASVEGALAEVLSPGDRLISINGFPVASLEEFQRVVSATSEYAVGDTVKVNLGVEDGATGEATVRDAELPALQETLLLNGARFQTNKDGDVWATVVTNGTGDQVSDLQPGDRIVALMPNNELIDKQGSFADILERELAAGTSQFNFAVNRDGEMWFATMEYSAEAAN